MGSIHRITAQEERGKELERWKRHDGMVSEVEMDKSAVGVKTLMEKSCNSQRREALITAELPLQRGTE